MEEGNGLFACGLDELIGSDDWPEEPSASAADKPSGGSPSHN